MSTREGQAPGAATLTAEVERTPKNHSRTESDSHSPTELPRWDDIYLCLPEEQRTELFQLAFEQGIIHRHQLPMIHREVADRHRQWFKQLLNGHVPEFSSIDRSTYECTFEDTTLDLEQRTAVEYSLQAPELCLIQGHPGTGKSRVIAEMIRQAIRRRQRVLLLSPDTPALDCALTRLQNCSELFAIRCLASDETLNTLVKEARRFTLEARETQFRETTLEAAKEKVKSLKKQSKDIDSTSKVQQTLQHLVNCQEELSEKQQALSKEKDQAEEEWQQELSSIEKDPDSATSPFAKELTHHLKKKRETLGKLEKQVNSGRKQLSEIRQQRQVFEQEKEELRPMVEASQRSGIASWFSIASWRAKWKKDLPQEYKAVTERLQKLQVEERTKQTEVDEFEKEFEEKKTWFAEQYQSYLEKESNKRKELLKHKQIELEQEADLIQHQWTEACALLDPELPRPESISEEALQTSQDIWTKQQQQVTQRLAHARQWADCLKHAVKALPNRLAQVANVVAATPEILTNHPCYGEKVRPRATFDILIVDDAERIDEDALARVAKRCRKWILVGSPSTNRQSQAAFHRIWKKLKPCPSNLPVQWLRQEDHLCCRLVPFNEAQEQWIESEPVSDQEEIVLRILAAPDQEPRLAEVHFPLETGILDAKEFLFKELEEITAQSSGDRLTWVESDSATDARFCHSIPKNLIEVPLQEGVFELVVETNSSVVPFDTVGFRFLHQSGWDTPKAQRWIAEQLGLQETNRVVELTKLHRMPQELAQFVKQLLEEGEVPSEEALTPMDRTWKNWNTPVGFIHVPEVSKANSLNLELDLANAQDRNRLPAELRAILPNKGLVNLEEAHAIVRAVEQLLADPVFRADACAWRSASTSALALCASGVTTKEPMRSIGSPTIAITALYPTQAQLIQHLLRQSRNLAQGDSRLMVAPAKPECSQRTDFFAVLESPEGSITIEVGVPEVFRQRECFLMMLGLTRSHSERPVQLSENCDRLSIALTRPGGRLLLFGDRDTLNRCLEKCDSDLIESPSLSFGQTLTTRLVHYLHRQGERATLQL